MVYKQSRPFYGLESVVIGPMGRELTLNDLPEENTTRWVISRKALIVQAVKAGLISLEEVCQRYNLSVEEFMSWKTMVEKHGLKGLRTTKIKHYRHTSKH